MRWRRSSATRGTTSSFLFRALLNSAAYQRTSRPINGNEADDKLYGRMPVKVMNAWQLVDSLEVVNGQRARATVGAVKKGPDAAGKSATGTGGDAVVRGLDTREVDDDVTISATASRRC